MKNNFINNKFYSNQFHQMEAGNVEAIVAFVSQQTKLVEIINQLNTNWEEEQKKRFNFFEKITPSEKGEFILGEVIMHSPAKWRHTQVIYNLSGEIREFLKINNIGKCATEKVVVSLTRNDFEPDVVFFLNEKAKDFTADQMRFPAPDFVVEVLSPSTEVRDRGVKFDDYALHGVKEYWIIDAEKEELEQYILENDKFVLFEKLHADKNVQSKVITGFTIALNELFL
jgi:Uma2 family endonuclease